MIKDQLRTCILSMDSDNRVFITLLSGQVEAITVELPVKDPNNPFYEPLRETVESMAYQAEANNKMEATPFYEQVVS